MRYFLNWLDIAAPVFKLNPAKKKTLLNCLADCVQAMEEKI